jgi:hypothetical protein
VECVWLARNGVVAMSGDGAVVYDDEHRPADAPTSNQETYWCAGD